MSRTMLFSASRRPGRAVAALGFALAVLAIAASFLTRAATAVPERAVARDQVTDHAPPASLTVGGLAETLGAAPGHSRTLTTEFGAVTRTTLVLSDESASVTSGVRGVCLQAVLRDGGTAFACRPLAKGESLDRPMTAVTLIGPDRFAVSSVLPPGATRVHITSRDGTEITSPKIDGDLFGVELSSRQIGSLSYQTDDGVTRTMGLAALADDPLDG